MSDDGILIGGPDKRSIVLQDCDPSWATRFKQERQRLSTALGELARRIEHVGSTSVTGLVAKPIIDTQLSGDDVGDDAHSVGPVEVFVLLDALRQGHGAALPRRATYRR